MTQFLIFLTFIFNVSLLFPNSNHNDNYAPFIIKNDSLIVNSIDGQRIKFTGLAKDSLLKTIEKNHFDNCDSLWTIIDNFRPINQSYLNCINKKNEKDFIVEDLTDNNTPLFAIYFCKSFMFKKNAENWFKRDDLSFLLIRNIIIYNSIWEWDFVLMNRTKCSYQDYLPFEIEGKYLILHSIDGRKLFVTAGAKDSIVTSLKKYKSYNSDSLWIRIAFLSNTGNTLYQDSVIVSHLEYSESISEGIGRKPEPMFIISFINSASAVLRKKDLDNRVNILSFDLCCLPTPSAPPQGRNAAPGHLNPLRWERFLPPG